MASWPSERPAALAVDPPVMTSAGSSRRGPAPRPPGRPGPRRHRRRFRELTPVGQAIVRGYALRAPVDAMVCPEMADVELPADRRPVYDRAEARAVLAELPAHGRLRVDSLRTRMAVCTALVDFLDPDTGMAMVGQEVLAERASRHAGYRIARTTAGDHLRALEDAGAVVVALRGRSREAAGGTRNLVSVYVVTAAADTLPPTRRPPWTRWRPRSTGTWSTTSTRCPCSALTSCSTPSRTCLWMNFGTTPLGNVPLLI